jgi:membrane-bound ClpP family serine protease
VTGEGRVRVDTELWRATTDGGPIAQDARVRVIEVRGTRLVVEED